MGSDKSDDLRSKLGAIQLGLVPSPDDNAIQATDVPSVIVFTLGSRTFAVDVNATEGVVECPKVIPLPNAPEGVVGVTSVRGRITVVLDLSHGERNGSKQQLILLRGEAQLGLLADRIESVAGLGSEGSQTTDGDNQLQSDSTKARSQWLATASTKIGGKEILIIDVERLASL